MDRSLPSVLQYLKVSKLPPEVKVLMQESIPEENRLGLIKACQIFDKFHSSAEQIKEALRLAKLTPKELVKFMNIKKPNKE